MIKTFRMRRTRNDSWSKVSSSPKWSQPSHLPSLIYTFTRSMSKREISSFPQFELVGNWKTSSSPQDFRVGMVAHGVTMRFLEPTLSNSHSLLYSNDSNSTSQVPGAHLSQSFHLKLNQILSRPFGSTATVRNTRFGRCWRRVNRSNSVNCISNVYLRGKGTSTFLHSYSLDPPPLCPCLRLTLNESLQNGSSFTQFDVDDETSSLHQQVRLSFSLSPRRV